MQIEWVPSPNFTQGRKGKKIIAIVNHITAGLMPGTLSWLTNPNAEVSAHYLVTKKGKIINLVKDEDTAWHCGKVNRPSWRLYDGSNPNYYTIGIEHEGLAGDLPTPDQWQATVTLQRYLVSKHGIPIDRNHIIGHSHLDTVNRKNCPGLMICFDKLIYEIVRDEKMTPEWKVEVLKWAEEKGIVRKGIHKPEETADKAFVLAVVKNLKDK